MQEQKKIEVCFKKSIKIICVLCGIFFLAFAMWCLIGVEWNSMCGRLILTTVSAIPGILMISYGLKKITIEGNCMTYRGFLFITRKYEMLHVKYVIRKTNFFSTDRDGEQIYFYELVFKNNRKKHWDIDNMVNGEKLLQQLTIHGAIYKEKR